MIRLRSFAAPTTLLLLWLFPLGSSQPALAEERGEQPLKLLISVEQPTVIFPLPVRMTLHLHNSGREPLWLYRRVRSAEAVRMGERARIAGADAGTTHTSGGSTLSVRLEPIQAADPVTAASGTVLETAGLPRPRLVRLAAGEDYQEKTVILLNPGTLRTNDKTTPIWGRYRLSVVYGADFSNAEEVARNLGVMLWRGEVESNAIGIELLAPDASAQGSVTGTVIGPQGRPLSEVLVSLSDHQERLMAQMLTGPGGRFSFTHLPLGSYWVTVRLANAATDTATFRQAEVTADEPAATTELVIPFQEVFEPERLLHKPVLLRVMDSTGRPVDNARVEVTWSNGTITDQGKGRVSGDGSLALELIPGRNFVTIKRRGCPDEDHRLDVAEGDGIDNFRLVLECAKT